MVESAPFSTGNSTSMPWIRIEGAVHEEPPRRISASTAWIQPASARASSFVRGPSRNSPARRREWSPRTRASIACSSRASAEGSRSRASARARSRTSGPKSGSREIRRRRTPSERAAVRSAS